MLTRLHNCAGGLPAHVSSVKCTEPNLWRLNPCSAVQQPSQLRGLHGAAAAQRPHHGAGPAQRRAPDARLLHRRRQEDLRHLHLLPVPALQARPGGALTQTLMLMRAVDYLPCPALLPCLCLVLRPRPRKSCNVTYPPLEHTSVLTVDCPFIFADGANRLRQAGGEGAGLPAADGHLRRLRVPP